MTFKLASQLELPSGTTLKNRIAKSAMSERIAAAKGAPGRGHERLYERWSEGGAGLLITGNVMIDAGAIGENGNVIVEDDRAMSALIAWARASMRGGNQTWVQLNHPGRQSPRNLSKQPVAPSAIGLKGTGGAFAKPRALSAEEIEALIERFAKSAALIQKAGFSGVQIHAAHGYLISQFLSPRTNLREDDWGGSDEKRRRFLLEVIRATRKAVGTKFPVSVKLNSADFQKGGFTEEASMAVVEALDAEGIDLLEISGGTYESAVMFEETRPLHDSSKAREAFFLEYAEKVRTKTKLPLMVTGGFRTTEGMEAALQSGAVDIVGLARPLAVEPDLPARLLSGAVRSATPVRLATGVKKLDTVIQAPWYQVQLNKMARGKPPELGLSRWTALYRYVFPEQLKDLEIQTDAAEATS